MTEVRSFDPTDEPLLRRWWEVNHQGALERPVDLSPPWEAARRYLPVPGTGRDVLFFAAFEADRVVAAVRLDNPTLGNTHLGFGELVVDASHRRSGVGSACLELMEETVRAQGRSALLIDVHVPMAGSVSAGQRFLERRGYAVANVEVTKTVDLAATEGLWPALEARAAERLGDYRLLWFVDPVPAEYATDVCAMYGRFLGEVPSGDVDLRPQPWDIERLRAVEDNRIRTGTRHLMVAAQAPSGELVGYTAMSLCSVAPRLADINSTLVLDGHRGHRLGLAMKVLLHQRAREVFPDTEVIVTGNADVNSYMNAVNDQLGYQPVDRLLEFQRVF
jgi:GNAT superfamily N-acetyltransferase